MTFARVFAAAATAATLAVAPLAPAVAQQSAPELERPVTDATIDAFVMAAMDVSEIAQSYQPRMQEAADDSEREALATEARDEMMGAVEAVDGISIDQYLALSQAARTDEDLNQRVMDRLAEMAPEAQQ